MRSDDGKVVVVHVGVVGATIPGGIAQMVEEYKSWKFSSVLIESLCTTRGKNDMLAYFLLPRALLFILLHRFRRNRHVYVVHLSQGGSFVREGIVIGFCRILGTPAAAHLHGSGFVDFSDKNRRLVQLVLCLAKYVYTLSELTALKLADLGLPANKVVEVRNAVTIPDREFPKEKLVLFAGAVGERKGVPLLISVWNKLTEEFPDWRLVIAGPVTEEFRTAHDGKRVEFLGAMPRSAILDLENSAAIAVLPSLAETLPLFLLESMSRSCAVVGTSVGRVPDLIRSAGLIVSPNDGDELFEALWKLMQDSDYANGLGKDARQEVVLRFSPDSVSTELQTQWLRLAGE